MSPLWFYLPSWTLEELLEANALQRGCPDEIVKEMFQVWGGKARYVDHFSLSLCKHQLLCRADEIPLLSLIWHQKVVSLQKLWR